MIEPNSDLPEFELRDVSAEKAQETAQSGGCGCGCDTVRGAGVPVADRSLGEAVPTGCAWTAGWAGAGKSPIAASRWAC